MKRHLKTVIGVLLSLLLLGWALRDVSPQEVLHELRGANLPLLALGVGVTIAGYWIRAARWGILLRPVAEHIPFRARFATTVIGFAANNVLPARVGEFARALSLSRIAPVSAAAAFASLVLERIFDALVLVGLLFAAMATAEFPAVEQVAGIDPRAAAQIVAVLMAAAGAVLLAMVLAPEPAVRAAQAVTRPLPEPFRRPLVAALESFLAGLQALRSGWLLSASLALALLQWVFTGWGYLLAMQAFDIRNVGMIGALFLQSLIALAVAVPSSPGFFGPFEAAAKLGLGLWGVPADKAVSFAVGFHLGGFIPVTLMGVYYVWRLNLRWSEVQHSEEVVEGGMAEAGGTRVAHREG